MLATPLLAATAAGSPGLFNALGLNLSALVVNAAAFLIVVVLLARFVYPSLTKALDAKRTDIEAVSKYKREAAEALAAAKATASEILAKAHQTADEIAAVARTDATETIDAATARAAAEAKQIVADAHEQLDHDVAAARRVLVGETARLIARASSHLIGEQFDEHRDAALIERGLKAGRR